MKKLLLKSILLLCALVVGTSAWADTVTRTENFSSSEASSDQYNCGSNISTAGNRKDWDYVWSYSGSGTVFSSGIKLGGSSATGSVTNTTMLSGISTGTSITIKVYAARWNTDSGNLTVTYNGSSESKAPANSAITSTSNLYSASDFSSSTNFTITKAADVTSFTIASSAKRILIDKVEVIYEESSGKLANELAWSAASKSVTYSETPYDLPTLSNPHSLAVTYESSNESVATVASDGTVTIKNVTGSTNISAHTDGDATYAAGTVSYTLNVTQKVIIEDGVFNFGYGNDYGSGMTQSSSIIENESETWTAGNVTLVVANRYAWNTDGKMVLYKKVASVSAAGSITLSCPDGKAITQIEFTGPYTGTGALSNMAANIGTYTVTSTSAIWTGAAQSVSFSASNSTYINTVTVTYGSTVPVTITSGSGFATLFTNSALDFSTLSSELKAYTATVSENTVTLTEVDDIPANTGVVLKGDVKTHAVPVSASSSTAQGNLTGNTSAATAYNAFDGYDLYMLALNGEGKAQFTKVISGSVAAGKAFLKLATSSGARELNVVFADEETTGVNEVKTQKADGQYFNLAGQRVAQPTKGLYIVNGKKVVIK